MSPFPKNQIHTFSYSPYMFSITQLPSHRLVPMMDPTPPSRPQQPRTSSSSTLATTFPILAITTLGILTTAVLLLSYYIFVIKCCSHVTSGGLLRRLLSSVHYSRRRTGHPHIPPVNHTFAEAETRGLEPAVIRSIPVVKFSAAGAQRRPSFHECAVCLSEFEEEERIKLLPSCSHPFHIDCIDTWLQFNAKCPLCRSEVMMSWANHIVVLSPRCEQGESTVVAVTDEVSVPTPAAATAAATSPSRKKARKLHLHKAGSVGDECIDVRVGKEEDYEQFRVQPVRRSISMDSSNDRQLYLSVQEILRQNERQFQEMGGSGEGCSTASAAGGGGRVRRPFFSFSWSARSPVLPVKNDVA